MGTVGKIVLYASLFALGFGVCYSSCVNKHYKIIEKEGNIYVEDRRTGKRSEVEEDFDTKKKNEKKDELSCDEIKYDLKRRVEDAYKVLTH